MMKIRLLFMVAIILLFTGTNAMAGAFKDNGNTTVTDKRFGLIWQKDGFYAQTWMVADNYCKFNINLPLPPNYSNWRLPDIKELAFLTDDTTHSPAIDTTYFPDTKSSFYWSATAVAVQRETPAWWGVNFNDGHVAGYGDETTANKRYVRCVSEPSGAN